MVYERIYNTFFGLTRKSKKLYLKNLFEVQNKLKNPTYTHTVNFCKKYVHLSDTKNECRFIDLHISCLCSP